MSTLENPCNTCKGRNQSCHSECERYAEWKTEFEKEKAMFQRNIDCENALIAYGKRRHINMLTRRKVKADKF